MKRKAHWDGRTVHFVQAPTAWSDRVRQEPRNYELGLTEGTARKLALVLAKYQQTYFLGLEPEIEEILNALNYVLVGDPGSRQAHDRMERSKGMTPDGGYRAPEPDHSPGAAGQLPDVTCTDPEHCSGEEI